MTEQNLPDQDLTIVGEDEAIPDPDVDAVSPDTVDELSSRGPDDYPDAAENNPDNWREDPLVQGEGEQSTDVNEPGTESDQTLRDETEEERYLDGDEQVPPEEPTIGEAAEDVDFDSPVDSDEADASDDAAHLGGSPLSQFEPEDLDR